MQLKRTFHYIEINEAKYFNELENRKQLEHNMVIHFYRWIKRYETSMLSISAINLRKWTKNSAIKLIINIYSDTNE